MVRRDDFDMDELVQVLRKGSVQQETDRRSTDRVSRSEHTVQGEVVDVDESGDGTGSARTSVGEKNVLIAGTALALVALLSGGLWFVFKTGTADGSDEVTSLVPVEPQSVAAVEPQTVDVSASTNCGEADLTALDTEINEALNNADTVETFLSEMDRLNAFTRVYTNIAVQTSWSKDVAQTTVFAPLDCAMSAVPAFHVQDAASPVDPAIIDQAGMHVLPVAYERDDFFSSNYQTVGPHQIPVRFNGDSMQIGQSVHVVHPDIVLSDGVVHIIDAVVDPAVLSELRVEDLDDTCGPSDVPFVNSGSAIVALNEYVDVHPGLTKVAALLEMVNSDNVVGTEGNPRTVFLPADCAVGFEVEGMSVEDAEAFFASHTIDGTWGFRSMSENTSDLGTETVMTTLGGSEVSLRNNGAVLEINGGVTIVQPNAEIGYTTVHVIDGTW